jgi:hypothetical protein
MDIIVPLVTAVLGFAGGLLTPWVKSWITVRESQIENRRQQVKVWRAAISDDQIWKGFGGTAEYASLRAHMMPDVIKDYEAQRTMYVPGGRGDDVRKHMLLDEIVRIEKMWNLI